MKPVVYLLKFSRTRQEDYHWLITADNISKRDYYILEQIFNKYKHMPTKKDDEVYCGFLGLELYYCLFSCYKTKYTDDCGRYIYSFDALCVKKENVSILGAIYYFCISDPQKYVQHEDCIEMEKGKVHANNFIIDIGDILNNYDALCKNSTNTIFFGNNFHSTFRGFKKEIENCISDEAATKLLMDQQTSFNTNTKKEIVSEIATTKPVEYLVNKNERIQDSPQCILSVERIEEKQFLFWKMYKYIIEGNFNRDCALLYVEKYFPTDDSLHLFLEKLQKKLTTKGFSVTIKDVTQYY